MNPKTITNVILFVAAMLCQLDRVAPAQNTAGGIVTNASNDQLVSRRFHLMIIGDRDGAIYQRVGQPRTPQLAAFLQGCEIRTFAANDPFVLEHHRDLLQKHPQLPILALVEGRSVRSDGGAVWWSAGGNQIPATEPDLASTMAYWYSETILAKQRANPQQPMQPQAASDGRQSMPLSPMNPIIYPSDGGGPKPFNPDGGRRPLISPHVDVDHNLNIPANATATVKTSFDTELLRAIYIGGAAVALGATIIAAAMVLMASILGNAMTNDDDDKDLAGHLRGVVPGLFEQPTQNNSTPNQRVQ